MNKKESCKKPVPPGPAFFDWTELPGLAINGKKPARSHFLRLVRQNKGHFHEKWL